MALPLSEGYILVDSKKCQGCLSCMMACSLVHEGEANLSLARIQVMQNVLKNWPDDIRVAPCRQCANPRCVAACPTGALHIDTARGNVRVSDEAKCDGCRQCLDACPYPPPRIIWNPGTGKAVKCDLCLDTPYWDESGGPGGRGTWSPSTSAARTSFPSTWRRWSSSASSRGCSPRAGSWP